MVDPFFWLALSFLLVAVSLTAVLAVAVPALRELGRASRSAEKLFDTLSRELPPTLEAIRRTGLEITELTDEVSEGVQQAGKVMHQMDQSVAAARSQAKQLQVGGRSLLVGLGAAWQAWQRPKTSPASTRGSRKYAPDGRNLRFAHGEDAIAPASASPGRLPIRQNGRVAGPLPSQPRPEVVPSLAEPMTAVPPTESAEAVSASDTSYEIAGSD